MAFGLNTTQTFVSRVGEKLGRLGHFSLDFMVGFTEEIIFNISHPAKAQAIDLVESQIVNKIPSEELNKSVSSAVIKSLKSPHVKQQLFLLIAGATPNLI